MVVKFNTFFNYFKELLDNKMSSLYESEDITTKYNPIYFKEFAPFYEMTKEKYDINESEELIDLLILMMEGQLIQETKNPFGIYLQPINFQVRVKDEYLDDVKTLISDFLLEYKEYESVLEGNTLIMTPDTGFTIERDIQHGEKVSILNFSVNVTILEEVFYSNNATIHVSGVDIEALTVKVHRATELVPDLRKNISQKFYPNTTVVTLSITGYYTEKNLAVKDFIEDDLMSAANFNQPYSVVLYKYKGTSNQKTLLSDSMVPKDIDLTFVRGSIAAFQIDFYSMRLI